MECLSILSRTMVTLHCIKSILMHLVMTICASVYYTVSHARSVEHSIRHMIELMMLVIKHFRVSLLGHLVRLKHTLILVMMVLFTNSLHLLNFLITSLALILCVFASVRRPTLANHTTELSNYLLLLLLLLLLSRLLFGSLV